LPIWDWSKQQDIKGMTVFLYVKSRLYEMIYLFPEE